MKKKTNIAILVVGDEAIRIFAATTSPSPFHISLCLRCHLLLHRL